MQNVPLLVHLGQPRLFWLFVVTSTVVMGLNYYLMATLPGTRGYMCVLGASLTSRNIIFALILSGMTGLMVAGIAALYHQRKMKSSMAVTSVSGLGLLLGTLTVFCTLCTIPLISLFGFSLGLGFFTDYNGIFKIISLLLMSVTLYFLNQQLRRQCFWHCFSKSK